MGARSASALFHQPLEWPPAERGLAAYRRYYGIPQGEALDWRPTLGPKTHERRWYGDLPAAPPVDTRDGLKIHLVGELGFNPERIVALEQAGHRLSATWVDISETWDSASSLPVGTVVEVPWGRRWRDQLRDISPDVIYALLNTQALPLISAVLDAATGILLVSTSRSPCSAR